MAPSSPRTRSCSCPTAASTCASRSGCSRPSPRAATASPPAGGLHHRRHQGLKSAKVGDTITLAGRPPPSRWPASGDQAAGVRRPYPVESNEYDQLRESLEKLRLNDASLQFEPEVSQALGFGFRCGFLGLLHMEIVQERLEREFDMNLITTAPTVVYEVLMKDGTGPGGEPVQAARPPKVEEVREPIITATIFLPQDYVGR